MALAKRYKEKECPTCHTKHRGRGMYCTKSCANLNRDPKVYDGVREYIASDKGQEQVFNLTNTEEKDPYILVGQPREESTFVAGGDLWTTDDGNW